MQILHELPRRIRLRNPALYDYDLDLAYVEAILQNIPGVTGVRINAKAASIVVEYDGAPATKERIVHSCETLPVEAYQAGSERQDGRDPIGVFGKAALMLRRDYFTASAIRFTLALGEYLAQLSEDKTTNLLKNLLRPQVETVWVERQGREIRLAPRDVLIGDLVICGTGEMIPVDGIVVRGEASINQSSITGESVPVHAYLDHEVMSGSVVEEGRITIQARRVGAETGMARISRFLENSLRFKSKAQLRSDQLADQLVPITLVLGLAIFALTRNPRKAASVLTVDYSCAIKLSNPVAVKAAMYAAAHCGVLLKGAQALETLAAVDTLVFDKTGTLTHGALHVIEVISIGTLSNDDLLSLAAGAEEHYAHPVANAVVKAAKEHHLPLPAIAQVDFIVAHGVSASVNGRSVLVGSFHFLAEDEGVDCSAIEETVDSLRQNGLIPLFVARDGILEGIIVLQDRLRAETQEVLRHLKASGITQIIVLTGDHRGTAQALAAQLRDIDEWHWELRPEDKADIVQRLQAQGRIVAFAGDGVNDAPVMVTADVGICMPGGADLARESAQVVLLNDDLTALLAARQIALHAEATIRSCFHAAVGINSLILLLATFRPMPPIVSALLHNLSTVGIVGYALKSGMQKPIKSESAERRPSNDDRSIN